MAPVSARKTQRANSCKRESVFKGWQLLCVLLISFPPSKNFETSLGSFIQQRTTLQEGRVEIIAKFCMRRLAFISRKGPRGKPPTIAEIETASVSPSNYFLQLLTHSSCYRMLHLTRLLLVKHWMLPFAYKNGITLTRRFPSSCCSLQTASLL